MDVQIDIAKRLKDVRHARNLVQSHVADGIGIKHRTYQTYEGGRAEPSLFTLLQLSAFYGFNSLDDFLGIAKNSDGKVSKVERAYYSIDIEKRKIVDFILNLNC